MGQEFKKIGARFDFRLRAPLTRLGCAMNTRMTLMLCFGGRGEEIITSRACAWGKLNRSVYQSLSWAPDLEIYAYNGSVDICERLVYVYMLIAQHGSTK